MALPPLQDILNLFPDNTQGLIEPADLRQEATVFYESISDNQAAIANRLPLSGGTLTGSLYLANDPVQLNEAATKNYVDNYALGTGFIQKIGDEMTGDLVLLPIPAGVNSAVTKGYADSTPETYFNSISDTVIFTDGSNTMNANYTPSLPQSVATRQYVDDNSDQNPNNLVKNPTQTQIIQGGLGLRMTTGYAPSDALDLVTKEYADQTGGGNLLSDGSIDMDAGYTPAQPQSIATKGYIDSLPSLTETANTWVEPQTFPSTIAYNGWNGGYFIYDKDTDEFQGHIGSNTGDGNFVYSHGALPTDGNGAVACEDGVPVRARYSNDTTSTANTTYTLDSSDSAVAKGDAVTWRTMFQLTANCASITGNVTGLTVDGRITSDSAIVDGLPIKHGSGNYTQTNVANGLFSGSVGTDGAIEYGLWNVTIVVTPVSVTISGQLNISAFNQAGNNDSGMNITASKAALQPALTQAGISGWGSTGYSSGVVFPYANSDFTTDNSAFPISIIANANDTILFTSPQLDSRNTTGAFENMQSARIYFSVTTRNPTFV